MSAYPRPQRMNSVAIIEQEIDGVRLHYIAVVISNVLRKNSAVEHQSLGTGVHRVILEANPGDTKPE